MVALGAACIFFTGTKDLMNQLYGGWIFPLFIVSGLVCDLAISVTIAFYLRFRPSTEVVGCVVVVSIDIIDWMICAAF